MTLVRPDAFLLGCTARQLLQPTRANSPTMGVATVLNCLLECVVSVSLTLGTATWGRVIAEVICEPAVERVSALKEATGASRMCVGGGALPRFARLVRGKFPILTVEAVGTSLGSQGPNRVVLIHRRHTYMQVFSVPSAPGYGNRSVCPEVSCLLKPCTRNAPLILEGSSICLPRR
jgi:hypothetical protein